MKATLANINDGRSENTLSNWQNPTIYSSGSDSMGSATNSVLDGNTAKFASEKPQNLADYHVESKHKSESRDFRDSKPFFWNGLSGGTDVPSSTAQPPDSDYFAKQSASGNFSTSSSESDELSSRESDISDDPSESQYKTSHIKQGTRASEINSIPRSFTDGDDPSLSNSTLAASSVDQFRNLGTSLGDNATDDASEISYPHGRSQSLSPPSTADSDEVDVPSIPALNVPETPVASPVSTEARLVDDEIPPRPHKMIKKKSGELVKSSLKLVRHRSLPSSPSKVVHFDSNLVSVRSFFRGERPTAVNSADAATRKDGVEFHLNDSDTTDGSNETDAEESPSDIDFDGDKPEKSKWTIKPVNFTQGYGVVSQNEKRKVFLDRIFLSADRHSLIGHIYVRNICYTKNVSVRYSVNYWKTFTEVAAEFNKDATSPTYPTKPFNPLDGDEHPPEPVSLYDRFTFVINLQDLPSKVSAGQNMCFCARFEANGEVYWGNNENKNYEISLQKQNVKADNYFGRSPRSARVKTRRRGSRSTPDQFERHHRRSKTEYTVPVDYEFDKDFSDDRGDSDFPDFFSMMNLNGKKKLAKETNQKQVKSEETNKGISAGQIKNKKKLLRRYNFGASWNDMLGRNNSTSVPNNGEVSESDNEGGLKLVFPHQKEKRNEDTDESKSLLSSTADPGVRPAWDSLSYKDLIHKYCFFGDTPSDKEGKGLKKAPVKEEEGKENVSPVFESVKV